MGSAILLAKGEYKEDGMTNVGFASKCSSCDYMMEDLHRGEFDGSLTLVEELNYCPHCGAKFEKIKYLLLKYEYPYKKSIFDDNWEDDYFDKIEIKVVKDD